MKKVLALIGLLLLFGLIGSASSSPIGAILFWLAVIAVVARLAFQVRRGQGTYAAGLPDRPVTPPIPKPPSRHIPQDVKIAVSVRDDGKCRICGSTKGLQYDHIFPWSKGGSSTDPDNIQLLYGYHNRLKRDL
jgi:hypothetical protein